MKIVEKSLKEVQKVFRLIYGYGVLSRVSVFTIRCNYERVNNRGD